MALHASFIGLLNKALDGFFELRAELESHTENETALESIMRELMIKHDVFAQEVVGRTAFAPLFSFSPVMSENNLCLCFHRRSLTTGGLGEIYGTVVFKQCQVNGTNYPVLRLMEKSWENVDKLVYKYLTYSELKTHVNLLKDYLDATEYSMAIGIVNLYARTTTNQRRVFKYHLGLTEEGIVIQQLRGEEIVSTNNLYVGKST